MGFTQRTFARAIGRSPGWVAKIETGERTLDRPMLEKVSTVLGIAPEELVAATDWNPDDPRPRALERLRRRPIARRFRRAFGTFYVKRANGSPRRRKALYTTYSRTVKTLVRRVRQRRDLKWCNVYKVRVTTAGEATWVLHALARGAVVEVCSPVEAGMRLMVASATDPPVYMGDRRQWCLRMRDGDLQVIMFAQVRFLGLSGTAYRADFVVGALLQDRVVWAVVEIDEPPHEDEVEKDRLRDKDVPIETVRIPDRRLREEGILPEVLSLLRSRLNTVDAPVPRAA